MATQEQMKNDQDAYGLAFNEDTGPAPEQTEDEAFGLTPPAAQETDGQAADNGGAAPAVAVVIQGEEEPGADGMPPAEAGAPAGEAGGDPMAEEGAPAADGSIDIEKETQRLKSWEGRLRAQQAELDAKKGEGDVAEAGDPAGEEMAEGEEPTVDQAISTLSADFGGDFVKLIQVIARGEAAKAAGETVGEIGKSVEEIIADITNTKKRAHFQAIFGAHPDFAEIADSGAFDEWLRQNPGMKDIADHGSADEINDMLTQYKEATAPAPEAGGDGMPEDDTSLDDAEGVRSTGLRLPESPAEAKDFKDAWDQF